MATHPLFKRRLPVLEAYYIHSFLILNPQSFSRRFQRSRPSPTSRSGEQKSFAGPLRSLEFPAYDRSLRFLPPKPRRFATAYLALRFRPIVSPEFVALSTWSPSGYSR